MSAQLQQVVRFGDAVPAPPAEPRLTTEDERVRAWWDERAASADSDEAFLARTPGLADFWAAVLLDVLGPEPREALDVGCGTGESTWLLHRLGHVARGVDLSPEMIRRAALRARSRGTPLDLQVADARSLPFRSESFDVVFARQVVGWMTEPRVALEEWMRVLRPGGLVVLAEAAPATDLGHPAGGTAHAVSRAVARALRAARIDRAAFVPPAERHPSPEHLPQGGGLDAAQAAELLRDRGLVGVLSLEVAWLGAEARASLPWYRRWFAGAPLRWHVTWGRRP